ncbi:MAG: hypothetical protein GX491_08355 [Chloroflexi bacterium]|nr:hypothetical protein [Chloroflexota bacterium]
MNASPHTSIGYWIAAVSLVLLTIFGWLHSPIDRTTGRPLLLIPEVKAVHDYQTKARSWIGQFEVLDAQISGLLIEPSGDLFRRSSQANQAVEAAVSQAQVIDRTQAPLSLTSLHQSIHQAALAYLEAARSALVWISTPAPDKLDAAKANLEKARQQVEHLRQSEWLIP